MKHYPFDKDHEDIRHAFTELKDVEWSKIKKKGETYEIRRI